MVVEVKQQPMLSAGQPVVLQQQANGQLVLQPIQSANPVAGGTGTKQGASQVVQIVQPQQQVVLQKVDTGVAQQPMVIVPQQPIQLVPVQQVNSSIIYY